jgi:2'-5' RNA ligase
MVALYPPPATAEQLALDGGDPPEELHVTLAFLGKQQDLADPPRCTPPSRRGRPHAALTGTISGAGLFTAGPSRSRTCRSTCPRCRRPGRT